MMNTVRNVVPILKMQLVWVRATSTYAQRGEGVGQMRMVRVWGGGGSAAAYAGGGGARLDWVVGACVGAACMAEKRAKIGRVSVENRPVFGNNTHLGALSAVVTRQIRSGTLH